jgi:anti-sigma factor RsiW
VTAFVVSSATSMLLAPSRFNLVRGSIVDAHLRALMASQPIDVASSDQHTVKPWFNGRIPQAPRVVDLAKEEFPLVGGRIDVIAENPVPSLVYAHRKHLISLTAVPDSGHANF